MTWYNMSDCDFSDFFSLSSCAQTISSNLLFPIMLLTIFIITIIGTIFSGRSFPRALTYAGFICSIISLPLAIFGWINVDYTYLSFFLTGVGAIAVRLSEASS